MDQVESNPLLTGLKMSPGILNYQVRIGFGSVGHVRNSWP